MGKIIQYPKKTNVSYNLIFIKNLIARYQMAGHKYPLIKKNLINLITGRNISDNIFNAPFPRIDGQGNVQCLNNYANQIEAYKVILNWYFHNNLTVDSVVFLLKKIEAA